MTASWGYRCLDCGVSSPYYLQDYTALDGLQNWASVLNMADLDNAWLEISIMGTEHYDTPPISWLAQHEGHNLVLENSYGKTRKLTDYKPYRVLEMAKPQHHGTMLTIRTEVKHS